MSKEDNTGLFQLIKSLSRNEKRYFKLFVAKEGGPLDKKFIRLFDLMDQQQEYSEEEILKEENTFKKAQMSNLKAHLYKRILQSLRMYDSGNVRDIKIRELIDHSQILYNRSHYKQCVRMLQKAKKMAQKHHNLELLLEIYKWEKQVLSQTVGKGNQQRVNDIIAQVRDVNNRINNINSFSNILVKLNALYLRKGFARNKRDFDKVRKILDQEMPPYTEAELSFYEKLHLYNLLVDYYFFTQDFVKGCIYAQKWVDLFEDQRQIPEYLDIYLKGLNHLMIAQYKLLRYHAFVGNHQRMKSIHQLDGIELDANIQLKLQKYVYSHLFNKFFMVGDFEIGVNLFSKIKPQLEQFINQLDKHSRLVMYYKIACLYFGDGKFDQATHWLYRIITIGEEDIREDVHSFARIINLICHFELGHTDVIPYYLRSTYRYLAKKNDIQQFQSFILGFIKHLDKSMTQTELIRQFQNLRDQLLPLVDSPYEKRAFIYFDIISWLESKIQGRKVADIIKEKAQARIGQQAVTLA
ncbi:MAG: hypothetical protein DHS20C17_03100 [Cyclobacteriaceae bacterium]|nr:MAG: hypothetical protein DHS20C17_03100 [Cyclobacteriaceae bacterium]